MKKLLSVLLFIATCQAAEEIVESWPPAPCVPLPKELLDAVEKGKLCEEIQAPYISKVSRPHLKTSEEDLIASIFQEKNTLNLPYLYRSKNNSKSYQLRSTELPLVHFIRSYFYPPHTFSLNCVKQMLNAGANPNLLPEPYQEYCYCNDEAMENGVATPLYHAIFNGYEYPEKLKDVMLLLLKYGANQAWGKYDYFYKQSVSCLEAVCLDYPYQLTFKKGYREGLQTAAAILVRYGAKKEEAITKSLEYIKMQKTLYREEISQEEILGEKRKMEEAFEGETFKRIFKELSVEKITVI